MLEKTNYFFDALSKQREDLREEYVHDSMKLSDWQHLMKKDDELNMYNQYHVNNSIHGLIMLLHEQISKQQRMIDMLVEMNGEIDFKDKFVYIREIHFPNHRKRVFTYEGTGTLVGIIKEAQKFLLDMEDGDVLIMGKTTFGPTIWIFNGGDPYSIHNYVKGSSRDV